MNEIKSHTKLLQLIHLLFSGNFTRPRMILSILSSSFIFGCGIFHPLLTYPKDINIIIKVSINTQYTSKILSPYGIFYQTGYLHTIIHKVILRKPLQL